jgi:hypothetical protein
MAESKNNFIKAKMNQDLDDRLISKGEYRIGQNVTISRSEGDDVGTFQNILGNNFVTNFNLTDVTGSAPNLEVIGYIIDEVNNLAYIFLTNYTDSSQNRLNNIASSNSSHFIISYNFKTDTTNVLVRGSFLNFSKTHRIYGVNLIENLLFFTDYRNQPRKINVQTASSNPNYYNSEDKISVAKFYPSNPLQFYREYTYLADGNSGGGETPAPSADIKLDIRSTPEEAGLFIGMAVSLGGVGAVGINVYIENISFNVGTGEWEITLNSNQTWANDQPITFTEYGLKSCGSKFLPVIYEGFIKTVNDAPNGEYTLEDVNGVKPQLEGVANTYANSKIYIASTGSDEPKVTVEQNAKIVSYDTTTGLITVEDSAGAITNLSAQDRVKIYRENPNYDANFSGDTEFLKDKFIRFSYRYKFDDNEYSLIAPFTQIAFIPQNFGSFVLNEEEKAGKTSVVNFFENNIDCIDLQIRTPFEDTDTNGDSWNETISALNIKEVEILCKFSNENTIKVIDVLDQAFISSLSNNGDDSYIKYTYKSTKPIRVLPEKDITRVYDKTPVRAFAQEVTGNRVMYGNYIDKHTSPLSLDFKLSVGNKIDIPLSQDKRTLINHNLKENRNYQVGIVLSDRYGRQSDVILSSIQDFLDLSGSSFGSSTLYNPYSSKISLSATNVLNFFGKQMILLLENAIPETLSQPGYPGLYSPIGQVQTLEITGPSSDPGGSGFAVGDIATGAYDASNIKIEVTAVSGSALTNFRIINQTVSDIGFSVGQVIGFSSDDSTIPCEMTVVELKKANPLGWYTYKIVVNQQQQEYYNVYIPSSYLDTSPDYNNLNSYFSLINDNINKVPKDLSNVGPEEKEFRSSVQLFPRVNPSSQTFNNVTEIDSFFIAPLRKSDEVSSIIYNSQFNNTSGTFVGTEIDTTKVYKGKSAALANVSNNKLFGLNSLNFDTLGVYETDPFVSNLDIYYESSTSGFISELNENINSGNLGPVALNLIEVLDFFENTEPYGIGSGTAELPEFGTVIYTVELIDGDGVPILSTFNECILTSVFSSLNPSTNIASLFTLIRQIDNSSGSPVFTGRFDIYTNEYRYIGIGQDITFNFTATANSVTNNNLSFTGPMSNIQPQYNQQANVGATQLGNDFIPISVEPYGQYSRVTGGQTPLSLRPKDYTTNPGDNIAAQGIGEFGSIPLIYTVSGSGINEVSNSTTGAAGAIIGPNQAQFGNVSINASYFTDQFSGNGSYNLRNNAITPNINLFRKGYSPYLSYGGVGDIGVGSAAPTYSDGYSAVYWWRSLLGFANPSTTSTFTNYPFQAIEGLGYNQPSYVLNLPSSDQLIVGTQSGGGVPAFYSLVDYSSDTNPGATYGPWRILEQNQNVSKFINNNGGTGFLNGTLNTNFYQDDLTYSLSDLHLPTGNIFTDPLNPTGRFSDPNNEIANQLDIIININNNGEININDTALQLKFGIDGSKNNLIPDNAALQFNNVHQGGLIINDRIGHGLLQYIPSGSQYGPRWVGSYGIFWIGFNINATDSFGNTTTIPRNIIVIS